MPDVPQLPSCLVAILTMASSVLANEAGAVATPETPALVRIAPFARTATSAGSPRLVVTVTGHQPSPDGPVSNRVIAVCADGEHVIGNFGVFPQLAFSPDQVDSVQRYGFDVPAACRDPSAVRVEVVPVAGSGQGASLTVSGVAWE